MSTPAQPQKPKDLSSPETLLQMMTGYWISQAIYAAAKLGIADLLKDGPKSADELARATGTHAPSLHRLLRALASLGIFAEDAQGRFGHTPLSVPLRPDVPGPMWAVIVMGEEHYR